MALHARSRISAAPPDPPRDLREWIIEALDVPMVVLAVLMLVLATVEMALPLPEVWSRRLTLAQTLIWILFVLEFGISFSIARDKLRYLKRHWVTVVSLALPFLRVLRVARALWFLRTFRATRLLLVANRGVRELAARVAGSRIAVLALLTLVVNLVGATGMFFLEQGARGSRINSFGEGLWWALGSFAQLSHEAVPVTVEGRGWAVVVQLINLALAGYLTAIIASYLVEKDRRRTDSEPPSEMEQALDEPCAADAELAALRERVDHLTVLLERRRRPEAGARSEAA